MNNSSSVSCFPFVLMSSYLGLKCSPCRPLGKHRLISVLPASASQAVGRCCFSRRLSGRQPESRRLLPVRAMTFLLHYALSPIRQRSVLWSKNDCRVSAHQLMFSPPPPLFLPIILPPLLFFFYRLLLYAL